MKADADPPAGGNDDRERLLSEVVDLRQRVARLGLALQVERERVRALEARLDADSGADGEALPQPPGQARDPDSTLRATLDRIWIAGGRALQTLRSRAEVRGARLEVASPATAWSLPSLREALALALILVVAVVARVYALAAVPEGFQGDEATAGLLGRRIAEEGWIGPYTTLMAGAPTGFYYAVAGSMAVLANDIFAIRLVSAVLGVLTVAGLYVLARRNFGIPAALAAAALLATAGWHVHFSRLGFPTGSWPFAVVVALIALVEAIRSQDRRWWAAAGALFGLALYTYNSHLLLLGIVAPLILFVLFGVPVLAAGAGFGIYVASPSLLTLALLASVLVWALASRRVQDRRSVASALAFVIPLLLIGSVLFQYIAENREAYFNYGRRLSIFNTEDFTARESRADQVAFVADRYVEFWDRLCCQPRVDGVDATGVTALVPLPMLLLAAAGVVFGLWGRGRVAAALAGVIVLTLPLATVSTVDFAMRRSLVLSPLLAMFAGLGVVEVTRWAWTRRPPVRYPAVALVLFLAALTVYRNLDDYFGTTLESQPIRWVLAVEMVEASQFVDGLPEDAYVYFYSDRWPWSHEIRRFFAPDARGEDRGENFGDFGFGVDPSQDRPVFLFLDAYVDELGAVQARYPGGETVIGGDPSGPDYVVYLPPPLGPNEPLPTEPVPQATPTAIPIRRG